MAIQFQGQSISKTANDFTKKAAKLKKLAKNRGPLDSLANVVEVDLETLNFDDNTVVLRYIGPHKRKADAKKDLAKMERQLGCEFHGYVANNVKLGRSNYTVRLLVPWAKAESKPKTKAKIAA